MLGLPAAGEQPEWLSALNVLLDASSDDTATTAVAGAAPPKNQSALLKCVAKPRDHSLTLCSHAVCPARLLFPNFYCSTPVVADSV